jgi:hypothetical protein
MSRRLACIAVLALLWLAAPLSAQVYEWRDAGGSRHFTTDLEDIPAGQREQPQIVVREWQRQSPAAPGAVVAEPRQAQVVSDRPRREVVQVPPPVSQGGSVNIQGPLAVAEVVAPQVGSAYLPYVATYYYDEPLVTTSFDRGRSRHRTLRMLLQDQFHRDRDGPFRYARFPNGLHPRFQPFLPRGLPRHFRRGGTVIYR